MYCPECLEYDTGSKSCDECGSPLVAETNALRVPQDEEAEEHVRAFQARRRRVLAVLALVPLVGVLAAVASAVSIRPLAARQGVALVAMLLVVAGSVPLTGSLCRRIYRCPSCGGVPITRDFNNRRAAARFIRGIGRRQSSAPERPASMIHADLNPFLCMACGARLRSGSEEFFLRKYLETFPPRKRWDEGSEPETFSPSEGVEPK